MEDFSAKPYFDDYNEAKGFHKILFKPSAAVQARELNQMQEILQQQIARLGTHLFKNGSRVVAGQSRLNGNAAYVLLDTTEDLQAEKELTQDFDGKTLKATVQMTKKVNGKTLAVIVYSNSATRVVAGETQNVTAFDKALPLSYDGQSGVVTITTDGTTPATGPATFLVVDAGVFFVDGYFVYTERQSTLISYNEKRINKKAGFRLVKDIVTAFDDSSLFDNATGAPNAAAPGADRFHIGLELVTLDLNDEADFIEMIRYENGQLRVAKLDVQYNVLEETLARRTYDESGDYAVRGLEVRVTDHLKDAQHPDGFRTKEEGGDDNKLAIEVAAGKAYVKGYEVENLTSLYLEVDKARTLETVKVQNNVIQANEVGEYILLAAGNQFFDMSKTPVLWLTAGQENTADVIGYAIPKFIESISISGQTIFRLYGSFQLSQSQTFGWQHVGGWKINDVKNGPVLQVVTLDRIVGSFVVNDAQPLTSHVGYTPYAWDASNRTLYLKKSATAGVFDINRQVVKGSASGYVTSLTQKVTAAGGAGNLIPLTIGNVKTTKDAQGNFELTTGVGFNVAIRTNAQGYGAYDYLGSGVFTGNPICAHTGQDNAYFSNMVNIENEGKRLVINNAQYPNATFSVSANLNKQVAVRSKTLVEGNTVIAKPSNREMVLEHKDVYRIKHVYVSKNLNTAAATTDKDIGQYFNLVNGDTIEFYGNTRLKAQNGFAIPSGQLLVVYEYFLHSVGDVFTADSYESLKDNPTDENDVTHIGRIPTFQTREKSYQLADMLDFRQSPRDGFFLVKVNVTENSDEALVEHDYQNVVKANAKVYCPAFVDTTVVKSVATDKIVMTEKASKTGSFYAVINAANAAVPAEMFANSMNIISAVTGQSIVYDASYFVDRWDRVVIYKNGEIRYVYGVPGVERYPEVPVDAMSLATLIVPAYTRQAAFVRYRADDNRRYTMRDIGKLEKRIENLEYYTSLTMKELETKDMKITDAEGLDRHKSGFFVTDFSDFGVFSPFENGFQATLVAEKQMVTPLEYSDSIGLKFNKTLSSNYVIKGDKVFLPYTDVVEIEQPYGTSTETINPYMIIKWNPQTTLTPAKDVWYDTKFEAPVTNVRNIINQQFNHTYVNARDGKPMRINPNSVSGLYGTSHWTDGRMHVTQGYKNAGTSTTQTVTTTQTVSRLTRILGHSVSPFMRSKTVRFNVKGSKPNTRYWASFDSVDVNQYCRPVQANGNVGRWGEALVSDAMGNLMGEFQIPAETFATGKKTFALADVDLKKFPDTATDCETAATYEAMGTTTTMQETIDVTNSITQTVNTVTTLQHVRVVSQAGDRNFDVGYNDIRASGDPLAQSFFTKGIAGAGMYVTKVDVYFSKKDPIAPVFIELREMVNGYPANQRIKGSVVAMPSSAVKVSDDSRTPTTFEFDQPIWLTADKEYALVVFGDSPRYRVWISRMGEKVVDADRIVSTQPLMGSLFKSQNASTWTPFQLEDLKFRLHRAKFNTNVSADWVYENEGSAHVRKVNLGTFVSTAGSKFVTVKHPNHGLQTNDKVTIKAEDGIGQTANSPALTESFNGMTFSSIVGTHVVKSVVDINSYQIELQNVATATGKFEDVGRYVYISGSVNYYATRLNAVELVVPDTQLKYTASLVSGKDFDGGQTPKTRIADFQMKNGDVVELQDVCLVQSVENETAKSVTITAAAKTNNDYHSPTLSLNDNSLIVASLMLNKPQNDNDGAAIASKIVTQTVRLKTASDTLRILTSENKATLDDIQVYYRTTANRDIEERSWTKVEALKTVTNPDTEGFIEHERRVEHIAAFDEFQIMIAFQGTNSCRRPALKELRVIAVAG